MTPSDAAPPSRNPGRLTRRAMHLYWRFARPMTLGVRAAILDPGRGVFLVRHAYTPGWHMPGGGVEAGETLVEALEREVAEEARIRFEGQPVLHGIFFNDGVSRRDHVAVYVVRSFRQEGPRAADREIAEAGFFPLDALPQGTTAATARRLDEIATGRLPDPRW